MQFDDISPLLSADSQAILTQLAQTPITKHNHLSISSRLRKQVKAQHANMLLETALLRQKAKAKFSRADEMYFDRAGLEMSSAEIISTYRAERFEGFNCVADLGCGIGGDALGLVQVTTVIGVDRHPARLQMAVANTAAYADKTRFVPRLADLVRMAPFSADAVFFDPARRDDRGKRIFSLANYRPPLTLLDQWKPITDTWGVKISPGVDYAELPPAASVEFISVNGDVREAVLWYGGLQNDAARVATLLPQRAQLTSAAPSTPPQILPPQSFIFEPDGAILRAQLVTHLATALGAAQIDPSIAYLTSDQPAITPFAQQFEVEDWLPFQLKRLRSYLRERQVGSVVIKKRGSPLEVDQLRQQLRLKGANQRTLLLTQHLGNPIVIVCL